MQILGLGFPLSNAMLRGSHGLSARRARRTKSRRPKGPKGGPKGRRLEVGARRAPKLLVCNHYILEDNPEVGNSEFSAINDCWKNTQ